MASDPTTDVPANPLARFLYTVRHSIFLIVATVGLVLVVLGATVMDAVLAGMFGIWGGTMLLGGLLGFTTLRLLRDY